MTLPSPRRSLASRMRLALALVAGLLSLGALGMLLLTRQASEEASRLYESRLLPLNQLETISEAYAISMTGALRQVRSGDMPPAEGLRRVREARDRADQAWRRFRSAAPEGMEGFHLEAVESRRVAVNYLQAHLETLLPQGMSAELGAFGDHQWIPAVNALVEELEVLRQARMREAQNLSGSLKDAGRRATLSGLALMALAMLLALLTGQFFAHRLSRGAAELVDHLHRVADGDLSPAPIPDGEDELAQARRELNRTVDRLRSLVDDLKRQRALEQSLLDGAQAAIIGLDLEGKVNRWSRGAQEVLGYTAEEVVGKATPALWRIPEEVESLRRDLEARLGQPVAPGAATFQAAARVPGYLIECHYRHKDGTLVPVALAISVVQTPEGQLLGTMGMAVDLRQVRRLEAELSRSERQYRGLVERLPGVVFQWHDALDGSRSVPFVSPQIQTLFAVAPEVFQSDPDFFSRHLMAEDRALFLHLLQSASAQRTAFEWEGRSATERSGETRWLRLRAKPTVQEDGSLLWDALLEDLSSLKETERALSDAEERWKLALDANRDGIWDLDVPRRLFWVSPRYMAMLGRGERDATLDQAAFDLLVHPDDRAAIHAALEDFVAGRTERFQQEFRMQHRDGSWRWLLSRASALRNAEGHVIRMVGSHADITEHRLQEQALRESEARAQAASRAKSAFLANMSHELRTPLSAILGYARLLEREEWRTEEERAQLHHILRAGEHLLSLINDVLSLSKIEAGRVDLRPSAFSPEDLFLALEGLFRLSAEGKGLAFRIERSGFPQAVEGDASKLRQVLVNLLGNALKFTEQGHVALTARWVKERAWFTVEDTGPGISAEEQGRMFLAFSQTDRGVAAGGTGLGLHISQALVHLLGGEISLASEAGRGSRFTFEVPLPEPEMAPSLLAARGVGRLTPGQGEPLLLVVDDRPENRDVLQRLLMKVGFKVDLAEDGARALSRWALERPRLVFMDLRMPVVDGFEATAAIRAREASESLPRTPIVAISASVYDTSAEELRTQGFDDFITKPIDEAALFGCLERYLGLHFDARDAVPLAIEEAGLADLAHQPEEWRERFKALVAIGDLEAAEELVAEIASPALQKTLGRHLRAYHLQELLDHLG